MALPLLLTASLMLFTCCWIWPQPNGFWSPLISTAMAWGLFILHVFSTRRSLAGFDPALWIPVIMLLHYFGMPIAVEILRTSDLSGYDAWELGYVPRLSQGFAVALLTFAAFLGGLHLAGFKKLQRDPDPPRSDEVSLTLPGLALFFGGFAMMLIGIPIAGTDVVFGDYGEMKVAEKFALADLRFFSSGYVFAMGGIYAILASHRGGRPLPTAIAILGAIPLAGFMILVGDRTGLSALIFSGGWAFTQRISRIPRWVPIIGFSLALLVMPMIKEFRTEKNVYETRRLGIVDLFSHTLYEMGSSLQVYCYTLDWVPNRRPYSYGESILIQIVNNVPNVGLEPGSHLWLNPIRNDPDKWITWAANPTKYYNVGGGYGFALGAEWYFNFGLPGVLLGMILTGYVVARVRNASRLGPRSLTFAALFFGTMVVIVRNDLGYPLRITLWPLIGIFIIRGLQRFLLKAPSQRTPRTEESSAY